MIKRILFTAFIGIFFLSAGSKSPENILPYPIQQKKLSNGLNVVTVNYDSPGLAAFYIIVRVGSRDEVEAGKTGFAHFFEHMMFRGTEKYSKEKYDETLKAIGASANANTWLDRTVYHMTGNSKMLDKMFELESDRFQNLKYTEQDFKIEAGAVKGEYTKNNSDPMNRLDEKMNDVAFTAHTYKHTTMGFFNDVVDMPNQFNYSLDFFKRFYKPEYCTILVVGDAKAEEVNALAEKYFGAWKRGNFVSKITPEPEQKETRYAHLSIDGVPPALQLNYKAPSFVEKPADAVALDILSSVLFSEKSELYNKLVVKEQKLRSLDGWMFFTRDPYLISVSATLVDAKDMKYIRDEITKAMEQVKTKPVDEKFLSDIKSRNKYSYSMGINSPDGIAGSLSYFIWVTGDPESLNKTYALYDAVSSNDLMNAAKKYFVNSSLTYATISADADCPVK